MALRVLMVAGEASADTHAARLVDALKEEAPDLELYGVGGAALADRGMDIVVRNDTLNAVGLNDWMDRAGEILGAFNKVAGLISSRRPDLAILLDLPDFNLRLARRLKAAGIPVVYYISPQVWAWRKYRIRTIRRVVDKMLVVFPFEEAFYRKHGVEVSFVGHPLLETLQPRTGYRTAPEILRAPRIGLLPGSRLSELAHHGKVLSEVARKLRDRYPGAQFRVPLASTISEDQIRAHLDVPQMEIVPGGAEPVYRWADCALVASGTATLEAALVGVPFTIFYRMTRLSGFALKYVFRYRNFFGMPNLLLGREAVREVLLSDFSPERLVDETVRLLESEEARSRCLSDLSACRALLGRPGASRRVAAEAIGTLRPSTAGGAFEPQPA
jgi:lipid-A-disaccharide synthase